MSDTETTGHLNRLLFERYQKRSHGRQAEWVLIQEAPSSSGFSNRYCDLVAIGVWASTKNEIIGHEVKASRSDWVKELQQPEKSEAFLPYCNRWYIVAAPGIVKLEELRADWGLMEPAKGGKSLKIRKQAAKRDAKPLQGSTLAAWLRRLAAGASDTEVQVRIKEAVGRERRFSQSITPDEARRLRSIERQFDDLKRDVEAFETASGVKIENGWSGPDVGKAVALLRKDSPESLCRQYAMVHDRLVRLVQHAKEAAAELSLIDEPKA